MIRLEEIVKKYGEHVVYDRLDCAFEGVTAILGTSGCGKTTLLNIVAGLTDYEGKVTHGGGVAYTFQTPRLIANLTVTENLLYSGADRAAAEEMLKEIGVDGALYPKQLSGGMADRVSLARAFLKDANVLLMDEPFRGLDVGLKMRIMELFKRLYAKNPRDVLFVTHSPLEAKFLARRAVVIGGGRVLSDLSGEQFTEKALIDILTANV